MTKWTWTKGNYFLGIQVYYTEALGKCTWAKIDFGCVRFLASIERQREGGKKFTVQRIVSIVTGFLCVF